MIQKIFNAFGTVNNISVFDNNKTAAERAEQLLNDLSAHWSVFSESSEISMINRFAGEKFVAVSPDTFRILKLSAEYSRLTGGIFDITMQPLIERYSRGKNGEPPTDGEIAELLKIVNFEDVLFNEKKREIKLKKLNQKISLGAVAKGYAADKVVELFRQSGVREAVINLGGTAAVMGTERKIGLQHPLKKTGEIMGELSVQDKIVVTSGAYEQQWFKDGFKFHHILDPRIGRPSTSDLLSVTLVGNSGAMLDALATAVFILGLERGYEIVKNLDLQAVFVTDKLNVIATDGLRENLKIR